MGQQKEKKNVCGHPPSFSKDSFVFEHHLLMSETAPGGKKKHSTKKYEEVIIIFSMEPRITCVPVLMPIHIHVNNKN